MNAEVKHASISLAIEPVLVAISQDLITFWAHVKMCIYVIYAGS